GRAGRGGGDPAGCAGRANSCKSRGVWLSRYFSTKAATPRSASARATSQPSFSIERDRKPPPGATITAAPLPLPSGGRKGVRVASVTLRAKTLPYWLCQDSGVVAPGSGPVPSAMAVGCAGVSIGVIVSSCAAAGATMSARAAAALEHRAFNLAHIQLL